MEILQRQWKITFNARFPDIVLVLEAGYNIVVDLECEHKVIAASLFQYEPRVFRVPILGDWKDNIVPTGRFNREAHNFHFWVK